MIPYDNYTVTYIMFTFRITREQAISRLDKLNNWIVSEKVNSKLVASTEREDNEQSSVFRNFT